MEGVREKEKGAPLACVQTDGLTDTGAWQHRVCVRVCLCVSVCLRVCVFTLMDVLELILLNVLVMPCLATASLSRLTLCLSSLMSSSHVSSALVAVDSLPFRSRLSVF